MRPISTKSFRQWRRGNPEGRTASSQWPGTGAYFSWSFVDLVFTGNLNSSADPKLPETPGSFPVEEQRPDPAYARMQKSEPSVEPRPHSSLPEMLHSDARRDVQRDNCTLQWTALLQYRPHRIPVEYAPELSGADSAAAARLDIARRKRNHPACQSVATAGGVHCT